MVQHCLFLLHSTFANPLLPSLFLLVHIRFDTVNYESLSRLFMHLFCLFCFRWHGFRLPKLGSRQRWRSHWIRGLILCCLAFLELAFFLTTVKLGFYMISQDQVRKVRRSAKKQIIPAYKLHRSAFKKTNWLFTRLHMDNRLIGTELHALNWERVPFIFCHASR